MKKDILYINSVEDIRLIDALHISNKDKELPNQIILTIQSAGTEVVTPIFSKDYPNRVVFTSIDEIGTKFILDGKEITSDDFQVVTKSQYGTNYNFFGLQFEDSNEHTLKVSLVNSTINQNTFKSNNYLTKVIIGTSITSIGNSAFGWCNGLTSVTIGNSVTSIGEQAFLGCSGLTSVNINDLAAWCDIDFDDQDANPLYYAHNLYLNNSQVTNLDIPNSVTAIKNYAFDGCTGLTSLTIPNSVTAISDGAFKGCSSLNLITSLATTAPTVKSSTFQNIKTMGTLHVPAGSDYSAWMQTSAYYLGKYNWTKVEDA